MEGKESPEWEMGSAKDMGGEKEHKRGGTDEIDSL